MSWKLGTTPVVPQIRKWLRGVDLNPTYVLSRLKLLILLGPKVPHSPQIPYRQYK